MDMFLLSAIRERSQHRYIIAHAGFYVDGIKKHKDLPRTAIFNLPAIGYDLCNVSKYERLLKKLWEAREVIAQRYRSDLLLDIDTINWPPYY